MIIEGIDKVKNVFGSYLSNNNRPEAVEVINIVSDEIKLSNESIQNGENSASATQ